MTLNDLRTLLGHANVNAVLHLVREKESTNKSDDAYRMISGGGLFDVAAGWRHPYAGQSAPPGKCCGAVQWLPHTWQDFERWAISQGEWPDFSPKWQDLGFVWLLATRPPSNPALPDILAGNIVQAMERLKPTWTSLPGAAESNPNWTVAKALACFQQYGGTLATGQPTASPQAAPIPAPIPIPTVKTKATGAAMGPLALLQLFAPFLINLIPQVKNIINPPADSNAAKNIDLAQLLVNTLIGAAQTAGAPIPQPAVGPDTSAAQAIQQQQMAQMAAAITAMQSDVAIQKQVINAVLSEPTIQGLLEVGGGIPKAREFGVAVQQQEKSFWYNPTFVVTLCFFPMMYMITMAVLFTVYTDPDMAKDSMEAFQQLPFYAKVGFDQATRSGLVNLIVGMVIGGVVGVWFGTSYGSQRKTELAAEATAQAVTKP